MNKSLSVDIGLMEGRAYVLGREGHIYINSPSASKRHAEIKIINGRIYRPSAREDATNCVSLLATWLN